MAPGRQGKALFRVLMPKTAARKRSALAINFAEHSGGGRGPLQLELQLSCLLLTGHTMTTVRWHYIAQQNTLHNNSMYALAGTLLPFVCEHHVAAGAAELVDARRLI